MRKLALIPARGGSKRLPGKNAKILGGKPLVAYPIEAAINSRCFDKIVLSTDSDEIAEAGRKYSEVHVEKRSEELASDTATIRQVALDLMERYEKEKETYDVITLLLPTAPFTRAQDIINGMDLLSSEEDINSVISVTEYDFPPQKGSILDGNNLLHPVWPNSPLFTGQTRTQEQCKIYHENGSFFICKWNSISRNKFYYIGKVKGYVIPRSQYIDIDTDLDFAYAEFLLDKGLVKVDC